MHLDVVVSRVTIVFVAAARFVVFRTTFVLGRFVLVDGGKRYNHALKIHTDVQKTLWITVCAESIRKSLHRAEWFAKEGNVAAWK